MKNLYYLRSRKNKKVNRSTSQQVNKSNFSIFNYYIMEAILNAIVIVAHVLTVVFAAKTHRWAWLFSLL